MKMILPAFIGLLALPATAAIYHVDFESGNDNKDGLTPAHAFKYAPGDPSATGQAAAALPQPGDTILFKGGVVYRGSVLVKISGAPGKPIVFDGNTSGKWGSGPAIIDGGKALDGWKKCASASDAKNNPRWAEIFYLDVPRPKKYTDLNLSDAKSPLPISQDPNPEDFFWQEHTSKFLVSQSLLHAAGAVLVNAEPGTRENKARPLRNLAFNDGKSLTVIDPIKGGAFTFTLPAPTPVSAVSITPQPKYAQIDGVVFLGDGKEILRARMVKDKMEEQRFPLPAPVTLTKLTIRFESAQDGETANYTTLRAVAAYGPDGTNVLKGPDTMTFTDPAYLNQPDASAYDGMTFAFHGGNNHIIYLPVKGYDPKTHSLQLPVTNENQYKETKFCFFNSVRLIDQPGEYSVEDTADPKVSRVFLLSPTVQDGQPADIATSAQLFGFSLEAASHITVQGFVIRRQNGSALRASGPGSGIVFRDCVATLVRGTVISASRVDDLLIERCNIHDNPGHSKGIVLHTCSKAVTRDCQLVRNTSTALDYYACTDGHVVGNKIFENLGSHANGLTFYLGNKNILVERNHVARGNCALTFQEGENLIFRNNILDSNGRTTVIGIWPQPPLKNVQLLHNTIVGSNPERDFTVGLFSSARKIEGLVVKNNIIDGVFSDHNVFKDGEFSHNLYTRIGKDQAGGMLGKDEKVETGPDKIFVDPAKGDYRLREDSPARGVGVDAGVTENIEGQPRPPGKIDLGAY